MEAGWVVPHLPLHDHSEVLIRRVTCIQISCRDSSATVDTLAANIASLIKNSNRIAVFELHTHAPIIRRSERLYHADVELLSLVDTQTMYHPSVRPSTTRCRSAAQPAPSP